MATPTEPLIVRVRVTSDTKKDAVNEGKKGVLEVSVKDPAKNNRANVRVCELLAEHFRVPRKNVMITKGSDSRSKMILVYKR